MPMCSCGRPIQFVITESGAKMPVDINVPVYKIEPDENNELKGVRANTDFSKGPIYGLSHFVNCPDRNKHSASRRRAPEPVDRQSQAAGEGA